MTFRYRVNAVQSLRSNFFVIVACLLILVLNFRGLTTVPMEADEAFTYQIAAKPWADAWNAAVADSTHPPVWTMALKLWMTAAGPSLFAVRLLPAVLASAALIPFVLLTAELAIPSVVTAAALIAFAANPTRFYYSHQIRSYGCMLLLSITSAWLFARLTRKRTASTALSVAFVSVNVALACTHYFGVWVLVIQCMLAMLIYREHIQRCATAIGLTAATWLLWMPEAKTEAARRGGLNEFIGWMQLPTMRDVFWYVHRGCKTICVNDVPGSE